MAKRPASDFAHVHGELARFEPRVSRALTKAFDSLRARVSINALAPALEVAQRQHRATGKGPEDAVPAHEVDMVMRALLGPDRGEDVFAPVLPILDDARARGRKVGRKAMGR